MLDGAPHQRKMIGTQLCLVGLQPVCIHFAAFRRHLKPCKTPLLVHISLQSLAVMPWPRCYALQVKADRSATVSVEEMSRQTLEYLKAGEEEEEEEEEKVGTFSETITSVTETVTKFSK